VGVVAGGFALHCLETNRLVFKRHVRCTHLPPTVALVPSLEPPATLNELQELQEDALAGEPFDYVRSDDSDVDVGGESDDDSDSVDEQHVSFAPEGAAASAEISRSEGAAMSQSEGADASRAEGAAQPPPPSPRRSTRTSVPVVRYTYAPRPRGRALRRWYRRMTHQDRLASEAIAAHHAARASRDSGGKDDDDDDEGEGDDGNVAMAAAAVTTTAPDAINSNVLLDTSGIGRGMDVLKYRKYADRRGTMVDATARVCAGMLSNDVMDRVPKTYRGAMASFDRQQWEKAVSAELLGITNKGVFTRLSRRSVPRALKILSCKWVFDVKRYEYGLILRYKAQFTVRGFEERYGIEFTDIFASVLRLSSLRLVLSISAALGLNLRLVRGAGVSLRTTERRDICGTP
jgi:hypothetical protein